MTREELARAAESATAQIAKILPELKPAHRDSVLPGLSLLASLSDTLSDTEFSAEHLPPSRLQQFAALHRQLSFMEPGERMAAIRQRLGISRSAVYRRLDKARAAGLVPNQSHQSPKTGGIR